jgi:hypothetical protein
MPRITHKPFLAIRMLRFRHRVNVQAFIASNMIARATGQVVNLACRQAAKYVLFALPSSSPLLSSFLTST